MPPFLRGKGQGWVTAEYGMLPRATHTRSPREAARGKQTGRTQEIQRLIGRSLRAAVDLAALGRAHGHASTAMCCRPTAARAPRRSPARTWRWPTPARAWRTAGVLRRNPLHGQIAAVSVGIVRGEPMLDLDYAEDSEAETDMNVVMNNGGGFVEVQGTAEGHAFRRHELDALLNLAASGIGELCATADAGARCARLRRRVLATANRGKQRELAALLAPLGLAAASWRLIWASAAPEETGATFEANALLKARHAARLAGLPALADDSGLEVDALGGRPGVHSARYAGAGATDRDNNARLLAELADVPAPRRAARYRCVLALVRSADDPAPLLAYGSWEGRIAFAPCGERRFRLRSGCSSRRAASRPWPSFLQRSSSSAAIAPAPRPSWPRSCARAHCSDTVNDATPPPAAALPPLSLYVHFPWCVRKCPYCDFNSHALHGELPEADYIDRAAAGSGMARRPARRVGRCRASFSAGARRACSRPRRSRGCSRAVASALVLASDARGHARGQSRHRGARPLRRLPRGRHQPRVAGRAELL